MEDSPEQAMATSTDLHVALPDNLVAGLDRLAEERGQRRVQVLREAVAEYLVRTEAERLVAEMQAYADEMAGHSGEFVAESGEHAAARLLEETEW
jgi:predicted transcriptional regulator